jgi:hypothetical protein
MRGEQLQQRTPLIGGTRDGIPIQGQIVFALTLSKAGSGMKRSRA